MLRSEDVAEAVWEAVNKPGNVYIEDVMIKDHLQSCWAGDSGNIQEETTIPNLSLLSSLLEKLIK